MAKVTPDPEEHQLSLRIHARAVERADALIEFVTDETGKRCSRSDVWREALMRGLRSLENDMLAREKARDGK